MSDSDHTTIGQFSTSSETTPNEAVSVTRLDVPHFYASNFQLLGTPNDLTMILGRTHPLLTNTASQQQFGLGTEAQAIVHISPQTAKELMLLLKDQVQNYEAEFGTLVTPFIRDQDQR